MMGWAQAILIRDGLGPCIETHCISIRLLKMGKKDG